MPETKSFSEQLKPAVEEFEKLGREQSEQKGIQGLRWTNPAVIGLFIAALGLIGNLIVAAYNDDSTRKLGVLKLHSDLILKAVSSHSVQESCQNLLFFIDSDLIVDRKGKITQECMQPLQQSYIPAMSAPAGGTPAVQYTDLTVMRKEVGDEVSYTVGFTIPNAPNATFSLVKIYCTQLVGVDRTNSKTYPSISGNWKPGDHVSFNIQVPKNLADSGKGWNLTFCAGTETACIPSPNLLLLNS